MPNLLLSPHQQRLLHLFVESGWTNKKLAAELGLTVATVKVYMMQITRKMGVSTITDSLTPRRFMMVKTRTPTTAKTSL